MNTLIIFIQQTKAEAIIEILALLTVAGIIGYITAFFYYKIAHSKRIKVIENERHEFNNRIVNLNADVRNFQKIIDDKNVEINYLKTEVKALQILHTEAVREIDTMTLNNARTEQKLYGKNEDLVLIAQRKHLLNYKSFGKATEAEMDDLKKISGIGPFIEERLHALDIYTFLQISKFTAHDIETINNVIEYFAGRIERDEWVAQAKEFVHNKDQWEELLLRIQERKKRIYYNRIGVANKNEADDLTIISGIGGWIQEKLFALDIYTFRQISNFNDEDVEIVTEAIEFFPGRIERDEWILQATELVRIAGKKAELLMRIKEKKELVYNDSIGFAHKHQANNLTLINGINLWIEERLNMLDIYTFAQISKLTPADVQTITDVLEITPGRIDRDNWISQANTLTKKQQYQVLV